MAKRVLEPEPEFVNTLFGLEPAPPTPVWRKRLLEEKGATKFCTSCRLDQPIKLFGLSSVSADGFKSSCNPCNNIRQRENYRQSPKAQKRVTDTHRLRTYGMTPEDFESMFTQQSGRCAICDGDLQAGRATHIDHCHKTGKVRSLLCMACNHTVGIVEKLPADISKYFEYVATHTVENPLEMMD